MSEEQHGSEENGGIRINKFLASCGIDSRRVADRLIEEGRVEVNGKVIDTPGMKVTDKDFVKVDGRHMTPMEEVVVLLNKPRGYVCSREAQGAIGTVYDLLPPRLRHLNYVGRLDADSEGLLIMTNKGELTQTLSHPTGGIEKEYWVTVDQNFDNSVLMQFLRGVRIPEGNAKAKYVCRASARRACIVLEQGLKRQVRQMFQCLGLRVRKLVRVRIGSLWGGDLDPGSWRFMDDADVALLLKNPPRQRKYLGAAQLATGTSAKTEQSGSASDSDEGYVFNPDDFEAGESYEPSPEMKTRFADTDEQDEVAEGDVMRDDSFRFRDRRNDRSDDFRGRREGGFGGDRREGGFQRREGGFNRDRREGGFQRREGGFGGDRREGGFQRREGGFNRDRREGGFQRREGGFRGDRREGGFQRREGGFGGDRREGGFQRREGGFGGDRREGGFQRREGGFGGDRREGGFQRREGGFGGDRREGGFQRREGGFGGDRREGGFQRHEGGFGGDRREGGFQRREGGFGGDRREGGFQRREGGFGGDRREGGFQRREGGFQRREGGFRKPGFGGRSSGGFSRGGRGR
ncbi:pseudouridine synthase [Akkermansia sp.]|uniref:pseudouridine synthase n=4 Tax=Akkermansia TaxID=239934 RepID=UPI002E78CC92|nr:pseudouridine synthase [Akkermansia sp.]MEE0765548.1 pseudouridine synthase [Akkermansia sp.]